VAIGSGSLLFSGLAADSFPAAALMDLKPSSAMAPGVADGSRCAESAVVIPSPLAAVIPFPTEPPMHQA